MACMIVPASDTPKRTPWCKAVQFVTNSLVGVFSESNNLKGFSCDGTLEKHKIGWSVTSILKLWKWLSTCHAFSAKTLSGLVEWRNKRINRIPVKRCVRKATRLSQRSSAKSSFSDDWFEQEREAGSDANPADITLRLDSSCPTGGASDRARSWA